MADLTRVHPVATPTFPVSMAGSTENITYVEIDYLAAVNAKTGPESTLAAVVKMLGTFGTVIYQGPLFDSNTKQIIGIEGCTTDTAVANFATMTVIQAALQALGTVDSVNLSSATAIRGGPSESKQDAIA
tara:strand:+ start:804 stop:1193 length:390 start_codon:yes stop_codon:yes gene_type:complete